MKRIAFVTLSRSDYASLRPVALAAEKDPDIGVTLIAGGSHLLKRFGETINDIRADGFQKIEVVEFLNETDNSDAEIAAAYARAVQAFTNLFTRNPPDIIFILGDRWEMLAVATVGSLLRIPIAHHSGGDITQGSADNQTRYVLSTLSHLHFVALDDHKARLLRMGEEDWRITVTGEPALTGITDFAQDTPDIHAALKLLSGTPFVLATFHPTSYDEKPLDEQIDIFIAALDLIDENIVLTAPNPDAGSAAFFEKLSTYANTHDNVHLFENLGSAKYYAAMNEALYMIGNSSSGLWEAPSFDLPVINIGRRQDGRTRGNNVIDTPLEIDAIKNAITQATAPAFRDSLQDAKNPYVKENGIAQMIAELKKDTPREKLLAKTLIDPLSS